MNRVHALACDICGRAVPIASGAVSINRQAVWRRQEGIRRWRVEHANTGGSRSPVTGRQIAALPALTPWLWSHRACVPEQHDYVIDGPRIATPAAALAWTLHLGGKTWFQATAWSAVIRRLFEVPSL